MSTKHSPDSGLVEGCNTAPIVPLGGGAITVPTNIQEAAPDLKIVRKRVSSLEPSPENMEIYDPSNDADLRALAESIEKNGLREPLLITKDNFVVSGHRRLEALELIDQKWADCRVLPYRRSEMTDDEYLNLLRDCNRQRNKTVAEQIREEMLDITPGQAMRSLRRRRNKPVEGYVTRGVAPLKIEGSKKRSKISPEKSEHVDAVMKIVFEDRFAYWPLSIRSVHYPLLYYEFFRNTKLRIHYANDSQSYKATSDLITRLRLAEEIPWEAFSDETRPVTEFKPFLNVCEFIRNQTQNIFTGYWRNLLQTQPHYIEVLCEKNTIYNMVLKVTRKFQIPTLSGRGFASIDPWHELYERYCKSGKDRLIVIVLSDLDPEGEMIPQVGGRTLRDDFEVEKLDIIKAGVTPEQIREYKLASQNFAKESSSNHDWFVDRNGGDSTVYELEALDPQDMLRDLEAHITSVLDMKLFNLEVEKEREEAVVLEATRKTAHKALKDLGK